jgi:deoxyribonuclease-4
VSGVDVTDPAALDAMVAQVDAEIGLDRLRALHVNDADEKAELGSNRDRHANIGEGELGEEGCMAFLSEPRFEGLPVVMETPGPDRRGTTAEEVRYAFELRERGLAKRGI